MRPPFFQKLLRRCVLFLRRKNIVVLMVMTLYLLLGLLWMGFGWGGEEGVILFSNIFYVVAACSGAICALLTAYRFHRSAKSRSRYRFAWLLIGLGMLSDSSAGFYALVLQVLAVDIAIPSLADLGYMLYYPLLFVGMLFLSDRSEPIRLQLRQILEAIIITLCLLGIGWYWLLVAPQYGSSIASIALPTLITALSYPFWDLLLLFAAIFLIWSKIELERSYVPFLCSAGLLANIWGDTIYAYQVALGVYSPGVVWIDLSWPSGSLCIGFAALVHYSIFHEKNSNITSYSLEKIEKERSHLFNYIGNILSFMRAWRTLLVALLFLILLLLTFLSNVVQNSSQSWFLLNISGIALLMMVILGLLYLEAWETRRRERERYHHEVARLEQMNRVKDRFLVTVSHEIRTPLAAVQAYLDLLAHYHTLFPSEQLDSMIQKACHSCTDLVMLLNAMLDHSHQPVELRCVLVQPILNRVMELIEPQRELAQRQFHICIPQGLKVQADPLRLRQVLSNLCTNALKYSPQETPVTIRGYVERDQVIISIKDQGIGIAPQDHARIFQCFVRLEHHSESMLQGAGLGLYISRHLVEAMKGTLWVESSGISGEGSTFFCQLPVGQEDEQSVSLSMARI